MHGCYSWVLLRKNVDAAIGAPCRQYRRILGPRNEGIARRGLVWLETLANDGRPRATSGVASEWLEVLEPGRIRCWVAHLQPTHGSEHDLRHDESGVLLVVGGYDIPRRMGRARGLEEGGSSVRAHVVLPPITLGHVGRR